MNSTENIKAGLGLAKETMMDVVKFAVNYVAVPVIAAVILGFIVFFIFKAAKKHKMGEEYQDDVFMVLVAVVALALVVSFPAWGWRMIGDTTNSSTSTNTSQHSSSNQSSNTSSTTSVICMLPERR